MSPHHTVLTSHSSRLDSLELIENPTCADMRAGPLFVPSPVTPTISLSTPSFATKIFLVMNEQGLENEERSQALRDIE
jgi:hypothetical protein